nr:replication initiation protein [Moraxella osloensis]
MIRETFYRISEIKIDIFSYIGFNRVLGSWKNRMFENLDFETLEKIEKSFEMIDKRFGGNPNMKAALLANYGIPLDELAITYTPSEKGKQSHQRNNLPEKENKDYDQEIKHKLVYGDKWFVLQNRLLNAISNLDLNERRLIMFLSPMVREHVEKYPTQNRRKFVVKALDFAKKYNIDDGNVYRALANSAHSVLEKTFYFWNFDNNERTHQTGSNWIEHCEYKENEGCLEIYLTSLTIEMLTVFDKANPFTKYEHNIIVKLGSYGIILFELIASCMHQQYKQKAYTIKYLREKFNCIETYPEFFNFKRYVIDRAIADIHKHTPYRIQYTQKKKGRTVTEIVFIFENTAQKEINTKSLKNALERDPNVIDMFTGQTDNEVKAPTWQTKGLSNAQIKKIGVNKQEFIDANSGKILPNDRRGYDEIFEDWKPQLKDPSKVNSFNKIQELLDRQRPS